MLILVLAEEMNATLGRTIGVLNSCGFKTKVVQESELRMFSTKGAILVGKHPKRRHNGKSHRRRFAFYQFRGFRSVGYVEGADREVDYLWWRDLFFKLRSLLWDELEREQLRILLPLERLKKWGD